MQYNTILVTKDGPVSTITLNRPDKLNAYNMPMVEELLHAIDEVRRDDSTWVLVITGAGRGFCAAADLSGGEPYGEETLLPHLVGMRDGFHQVVLSLSRLDKPTIASINGPATAGGLAMALACDLRIASDRAVFRETSLMFGAMPDEGGSYFLPRIVGLEKALELILLSDRIDAHEAKRIGLVGKVVPHEELGEATRELAVRLGNGPPIALRMSKRAVYRQLDMDLENALEDLAQGAQIVNDTDDVAEGSRAFFEKRKPIFKGR